MAHDVTVLGSINLDVVLAVAAVPVAGETVLASGQRRTPGGKGLNQAVAAASTTLRGARERAVVAGAHAVEAAGATASVPTADQVRARSLP